MVRRALGRGGRPPTLPRPAPPRPAGRSPPRAQFFQQGNNNDNDLITLGLGVAMLYLIYKAYATIYGA